MRHGTFALLVSLLLLGLADPAPAQTFVFGAQGEPVHAGSR